MQPRVSIAVGTAYDVILAAAAVADPTWRETFAMGPAAYAEVLSKVGQSFVEQVGAFGRFGWINLVALAPSPPAEFDLDQLTAAVRRSTVEDLHVLAVGGDRRQLRTALGDATIRAAVRGDPQAVEELRALLAGDELVLEVSPWLVTTPSAVVQETMLALLQTWQARLLSRTVEDAQAESRRAEASAAKTILATVADREFMSRAVGGLHYDSAGLDVVLAISTPMVSPVVVVVDGSSRTVVLHPPLTPPPGADTSEDERLVQQSRALGDRTRLRLLACLRDGPRTAVELAHLMAAPRTTLLHHLAILRAAGFLRVDVTAGGATIYRLRPEGFEELAAAAAGFIPTR